MYLIGGIETTEARTGTVNDVWLFDTNSNTFTISTAQAPFAPRHSHSAFVWNDKMYLIAGKENTDVALNDVWSWNGIDADAWTQEPHAAFAPRYGQIAQLFNTSVLVTGGYDDNQYFNDVWQFDGVNWDAVLPAPFTRRSYMQSLIFRRSLFIIGGQTKSTSSNEVWSFDRTSWSGQPMGSWSGRSKFTACVNPFNDASSISGESLLVLGGVDRNGRYYNDVWMMKDINKPSAPLSITAKAIQSSDVKIASNSMQISWLPSLIDGGAPITSIIIRNSFDDSIVTLNSSIPSPYIIQGLSIACNYSFRLSAANIAGEGEMSPYSNQQTTAAAGYLINDGGKIASNSNVIPVEAPASDSLVTKSWFIATMVILSVAVLVIGCIIFVWRYLRKANKDLIKLDEIEALDDSNFTMPSDEGVVEAGVVDLKELGISGIAKRDKNLELHAWRKADLKQKRHESGNEAFKKSLDRSLVAPLGFTIGGEEEEEAIERLGAEMERLEQEERQQQGTLHDIFPDAVLPQHVKDRFTHQDERKYASVADDEQPLRFTVERTGDASSNPTSPTAVGQRPGSAKSHSAGQSFVAPSEDTIRERCEEASEYLCELFSMEYTKRIMANPLHPRLMTTEPLHNLLAHAFYASGALKHMATDALTHQQQRQALVEYLLTDLVDQVSTDAADERERLASNGKQIAAEDGLGDANETYLFLRARACMLRWLFEQVKHKRERQREKMQQLAKWYGKGLIVAADGRKHSNSNSNSSNTPAHTRTEKNYKSNKQQRDDRSFAKLVPPPQAQRTRFNHHIGINEEDDDNDDVADEL